MRLVDEASILKTFETLDLIERAETAEEKENILTQESHNDVLLNILRVAYDPHMLSNVKDICIPEEDIEIRTLDRNYMNALIFISNVVQNNISPEVASEQAGHFLAGCRDYERKWYYRLLTNQFDIGICHNVINRAFGKEIIELDDVKL